MTPKILYYFLIGWLLLFFGRSIAQESLPLPSLWYQTGKSSDGRIHLADVWGQQSPILANGIEKVNFHPVPVLSEPNRHSSVLGQLSQPRLTAFTVYRDLNASREQVIWSLNDQDRPLFLSTDRRYANWVDSTDFLLHGLSTEWLRISTIFSSSKKTESQEFTFEFGQRRGIPFSSFDGILPEVLLFDRVLTPRQQQQVASYLAIKYGIPLLAEGKIEYIDSRNDVYWSCPADGSFRHHITGLGRDDFWGLHQKQATSSYEDRLLTIGLGRIIDWNREHPGSLEPNSFLLWADNNAPLRSVVPLSGEQALLARRWEVTSIHFPKGQHTELQFDQRQSLDQLDPGERYWLVIDRSGSNSFPINETDYYWPIGQEGAEISTYTDIPWDVDGSGSDLFTFRPGPDMILVSEILQPTCDTPQSGQLRMHARGGQAPYQYRIANEGGEIIYSGTWDGQLRTWPQLSTGTYYLVATDRRGHQFSDTLQLHYAGLIDATQLQSEYTLSERGAVALSVSDHCFDCHYTWQMPGGKTSYDTDIQLSKAGRYSLQIDQGNCSDIYHFRVLPARSAPFQSVRLWNNPAQGGDYTLEIQLWEERTVQLRVFDDLGRLIQSDELSQSQYYKYRGQDLPAGSYRIQILCNGQQITKNLIMF